MREIKFRAWDLVEKVMLYDGDAMRCDMMAKQEKILR